MSYKLMYMPNNDAQNYPFYQLVVKTFAHSTYWTNQSKFNIKVPKIVKPMNKKTVLKNVGD